MKKIISLLLAFILIYSCSSPSEKFNLAFVYDEQCTEQDEIIDGISLALNESLPDKSFNISQIQFKSGNTALEVQKKLERRNPDIIFISLYANTRLDKLMNIAAKMNIPLIDPVNFKEEYRHKNDNLFFITPSQVMEAGFLSQVVVKDYVRKISIIRDSALFDTAYTGKFKENFLKAGGRIINETNFSSEKEYDIKEICRSASRGSEALLIMASVNDTIEMIKLINSSTALKNYYLPSKTIYYNKELAEQLKNQEVNLKTVSYTPYRKTIDAYQVFLKNYLIRYDKNPDYTSEYAYLSSKMMLFSFQKSLEENISLMEAMKTMNKTMILGEEFQWDSYGDPAYSSYSFQLINGQFQILQEL